MERRPKILGVNHLNVAVENLGFGKEFYFGAVTAAHQVEGGNRNDWTEWEKESAKRLAREAKERRGNDPSWRFPEAFTPENYISGRACDHYNRFGEDFGIAKFLGHNAHRFSIEWSRIEPGEGRFDEREIQHYREVVAALRERGIEPFVTLWHWTVPLWFRDRGGWPNGASPEYFARYAKKIVSSLPEVKFWVTLNETNVYTNYGYHRGIWPPEKSSLPQYFEANRRLSQAHCLAYGIIKGINPDAKVGVAHNFKYVSKPSARFSRYRWNHVFLHSIHKHHDFIGVNYYTSDRDTGERAEFDNWSIDPEGLYFVLRDAAEYRKPIYVLENGIADVRDTHRAKFIRDHLRWLGKAMADGVDVRGYFYWSLLDNFEWSSGFWPRFGLVEVDYETQERKIRKSAYAIKRLLREILV